MPSHIRCARVNAGIIVIAISVIVHITGGYTARHCCVVTVAEAIPISISVPIVVFRSFVNNAVAVVINAITDFRCAGIYECVMIVTIGVSGP